MNARGKAEINVTPLIDVLLVLLIIFMVIRPEHPVGIRALAPDPGNRRASPRQEVVVTIAADSTLKINTEPVAWDDLDFKLRRIFPSRGAGVLFVTGAPKADFEDVARVLDTARGAGIDHVALMPRDRSFVK